MQQNYENNLFHALIFFSQTYGFLKHMNVYGFLY